MADVKPNYSLEIQCMELEQAQLKLNIQAQQYRVAQSEDEIRRIATNIEATHAALAALEDRISSLKGAK